MVCELARLFFSLYFNSSIEQDKYVLMSLVFLVLICVWHSIVPTICGDKENFFYQEKMEHYVLLAFFVIYIVGHVLFATFIYIHAWKRRLEMAQKDREFRVSKINKALLYAAY